MIRKIRRKRNHAKKQEKEGEEKAKEQNMDGDCSDHGVSWRAVCVCNSRFAKGSITKGKRESSSTFSRSGGR